MQQTGRQPAGSRIDSAAVGATPTTRSFSRAKLAKRTKPSCNTNPFTETPPRLQQEGIQPPEKRSCVPAFLRLRQVTKAFNVFDRDGSGAIDRQEFSLAVRIVLTHLPRLAHRGLHIDRGRCAGRYSVVLNYPPKLTCGVSGLALSLSLSLSLPGFGCGAGVGAGPGHDRRGYRRGNERH